MKTKRPTIGDDSGGDWATADTCHEQEQDDHVYTGLLDARGEPIYRPRLAVKFGFQGSKV